MGWVTCFWLANPFNTYLKVCCGCANHGQLVSCTNCNVCFWILKVGQASCILFPDRQNIDPEYQFLCPTCHQHYRKGAFPHWVQSYAAVSLASPSKPRPLSLSLCFLGRNHFPALHAWSFSRLSCHGTHKTAPKFVILALFSCCPILKIIIACSSYL